MPKSNNSKICTYIRTTTIERTTGKVISESYSPYREISEGEYIDTLLHAFVGNLDNYVTKMLNDLKEQPKAS